MIIFPAWGKWIFPSFHPLLKCHSGLCAGIALLCEFPDGRLKLADGLR